MIVLIILFVAVGWLTPEAVEAGKKRWKTYWRKRFFLCLAGLAIAGLLDHLLKTFGVSKDYEDDFRYLLAISPAVLIVSSGFGWFLGAILSLNYARMVKELIQTIPTKRARRLPFSDITFVISAGTGIFLLLWVPWRVQWQARGLQANSLPGHCDFWWSGGRKAWETFEEMERKFPNQSLAVKVHLEQWLAHLGAWALSSAVLFAGAKRLEKARTDGSSATGR